MEASKGSSQLLSVCRCVSQLLTDKQDKTKRKFFAYIQGGMSQRDYSLLSSTCFCRMFITYWYADDELYSSSFHNSI